MYKIIIFDLWQTLVDVRIKPISGIYSIIKPLCSFVDFQKSFSTSKIFLEPCDIDLNLRVFLSNYSIDSGKINDSIEVWKSTPDSAFLYDNVDIILCKLIENNYTLVLMSNIDQFGYDHFKFKKLLLYFDYTFISFIEHIVKPDLKCWGKINTLYSCPYSEMIMIGDNYYEDIIPAEKLGLVTYWTKIHSLNFIVNKIINNI